MPQVRRVLSVIVAAAVGSAMWSCRGGSKGDVFIDEGGMTPPGLKTVSGAPTDGPTIVGQDVPTIAVPLRVSAARGTIIVGTAAGVFGGDPASPGEEYESVRTHGALILRRLEADGVPPMPPQSSEVLTPSQYAVFPRWIAGGMQP